MQFFFKIRVLVYLWPFCFSIFSRLPFAGCCVKELYCTCCWCAKADLTIICFSLLWDGVLYNFVYCMAKYTVVNFSGLAIPIVAISVGIAHNQYGNE